MISTVKKRGLAKCLAQDLQQMQHCGFNNLTDISKIKIETDKPTEDRLKDFLTAIKNPYFFKVGDTTVRVRFLDDGQNLEKCIETALMSLINA